MKTFQKIIAALLLLIGSSQIGKAADSYTPNCRIVQMPTGSNDTLWGTKANAAFAMLDQCISQGTVISVTGGNVTLTTANNAADQARSAIIAFTGTPGVMRNITMPNVSKMTWVVNKSNASLLFNAGAGLTATVTSGSVALLYTDAATNVTAPINVASAASTWTAAPSTSPLLASALGLGMSPTNILDVTQSQNGNSVISFLNGSTGTAAQATLILRNSGSGYGALFHYGTGYTPLGLSRADGTNLLGTGAGGLTISTGQAQPIYFGINSAFVGEWDNAGNHLVGDSDYHGHPSNISRSVAGVFTTMTGQTTAVSSGGSATLFTLPAGGSPSGAWIVSAQFSVADANTYGMVYLIMVDNQRTSLTALKAPTFGGMSVGTYPSPMDVVVTNGAGSPQIFYWSAIRIH